MEKTEQMDQLKKQLKEFIFSNINLNLFEEMAKVSKNLLEGNLSEPGNSEASSDKEISEKDLVEEKDVIF